MNVVYSVGVKRLVFMYIYLFHEGPTLALCRETITLPVAIFPSFTLGSRRNLPEAEAIYPRRWIRPEIKRRENPTMTVSTLVKMGQAYRSNTKY